MKRTSWWTLIAAALLPLACDDGLRDPVTGPEEELVADRSASPIASCDASYVSRRRARITVLPTGTDDTRNLQCAFDAAKAGDVVQLVAGEYHTAQIAVAGFRGAFRGRGAYQTVIYNLPDLVVTAQDFFTERPDADHTWPSLFAFWESDLTVSDLAIKIVGEEPTTGWSIFGLQLHELGHAIVVLGRTGNVRVHDIVMQGEASPNALVGTNLINGIYPEGAFGGNPDAMSGSFTVERSTFRMMGDPFPFSVVDRFTGRFAHNRVESAFGVSGGDLANASVVYADNAIESVLGIWLYNVGVLPYGVQTSEIVVRNNRFRGDWGAFFEATLGPDVRCLLRGNDAEQTANGFFLGPGWESACHVSSRQGRPNEVNRSEAVSRQLVPFRVLRGRS